MDKCNIFNAMVDIVTKHIQNEKMARNYGTDVNIYYAEIHLISAIALYPGIHVGGLAEYFGYTKGAISESIRKLEKKGLVYKEVDHQNHSRLLIYLTAKGETAHHEHMKQHLAVEKISEELFKDMPEEHIKAVQKFLSELSKKLVEMEHSI